MFQVFRASLRPRWFSRIWFRQAVLVVLVIPFHIREDVFWIFFDELLKKWPTFFRPVLATLPSPLTKPRNFLLCLYSKAIPPAIGFTKNNAICFQSLLNQLTTALNPLTIVLPALTASFPISLHIFLKVLLWVYNRVIATTTASIAITHGLKPAVANFTAKPRALKLLIINGSLANLLTISTAITVACIVLKATPTPRIVAPNVFTTDWCLAIKPMNLAACTAAFAINLASICRPCWVSLFCKALLSSFNPVAETFNSGLASLACVVVHSWRNRCIDPPADWSNALAFLL